MYFNATSLENKFDEFTVVVDTNRPNLIGVSETWFKNVSVVNMNGYNLYRKDRCEEEEAVYAFMSIIQLIHMKLAMAILVQAKLNKSGLFYI